MFGMSFFLGTLIRDMGGGLYFAGTRHLESVLCSLDNVILIRHSRLHLWCPIYKRLGLKWTLFIKKKINKFT